VQFSSSRTKRPPRSRQCAVAAGFALLLTQSSALAQQWNFKGVVADGEQLDAVAGPAGKIHLLSSGYHQLDKDENVVVSESQGESAQNYLWAFMFPPAIAVGPDGTVHTVVREGGGFDGWLDLRHRRRDPSGNWDGGYTYSTPTKWNWNVGVADDGAGNVHLLASNHGGGGSVWADLEVYLGGDGSATNQGSISNAYRVDYEARMRGRGGKIYLATSNAFTSSDAYFSHAIGGSGLASQFGANLQSLHAGSGAEKGFPDLAIDGLGNVHFMYGSGHTNHDNFPGNTSGCVPGEVHYNKFDANGNKLFPSDSTVFTGLGVWHLSVGLSAVGASDDGNTVVAVALRSPDDKEAANSDILWAASSDGGATWSAPQDLGVNTHAGEGRRRPRLAALGSKFFLFYRDQSTQGISLATIAFPELAPAAPTDLTAVATSTSQIDVCWQENASNEEGLVVERKQDGSFQEITVTAADTKCFSDTDLSPATNYTYRVRAFLGESSSEYSNEASATTHASSTSDAGVPPDGSTADDAAWTPIEGGADAPVEDGDSTPTSAFRPEAAEGCACRTRPSTPSTAYFLPSGLALLLLCRRRRATTAPGKQT
jgi:Fibronectin type III domain